MAIGSNFGYGCLDGTNQLKTEFMGDAEFPLAGHGNYQDEDGG
jgi:hypothetical protein